MYYRIKNWEKFQHYHTRRPPWIKLYHDTLEDYQIGKLSDAAFRFLINVWLIGSEDINGILPSSEELAYKLRIDDASKVDRLLNEIACSIIASDKPFSIPEERREELEKEKRQSASDDSFDKKSKPVTSEWLAEIKKNKAYAEIDFDLELSKMDTWLTTDKGAGKKRTRQLVFNWMNKAIEIKAKSSKNGEPKQKTMEEQRIEAIRNGQIT